LSVHQTAELAVFSAIARQKCFETLRTVLFELGRLSYELASFPHRFNNLVTSPHAERGAFCHRSASLHLFRFVRFFVRLIVCIVFTNISSQSSDYVAPVIDSRIRDFLATFPTIIQNTPASDFANFRSGAATDVAETDKVRLFIVAIVTSNSLYF
jgi:hypothetical protein